MITTVNNADKEVVMNLQVGGCAEYIGALTGERISVNGGLIQVKVCANSGEIWIPAEIIGESFAPIPMAKIEKTINQPLKISPKKEEPTVEIKPEKVTVDWNKAYEDMTIEELQEAILEKMRKNGPVTDYMLGTVRENTHQGSLITWVKSFIY